MGVKAAGWLIAIYLVLIVSGFVGWVLNVITIAQSDFVLSGMLVLRCIGVVLAPLGAVLGYF